VGAGRDERRRKEKRKGESGYVVERERGREGGREGVSE
jgi:hypothetical protein